MDPQDSDSFQFSSVKQWAKDVIGPKEHDRNISEENYVPQDLDIL